MQYLYIDIFLKKLKQVNDETVDYKEFFSYVIARSREDLVLCLHLSNRNLSDINLDEEIDNEPVSQGSFLYKCKCQYKKERKCACKIPYLVLLDECFSLSLIL